MENLSNKHICREFLKKRRAEISPLRREEARLALLHHLLPLLDGFKHILSFSSFGTEIDTTLLNLYLARTKCLLLPKTKENFEMSFFLSDDSKSQQVSLINDFSEQTLQVILVPALGFDRRNHRIGYGQGFYDRFLSKNSHAHTIGIGFKEQFLETLPVEPKDIPLEKVFLF